jgi:hypothetical protein
VRSCDHLSRILNSTDPKLIGGYGLLAYGTRLPGSLPDAFEDDLLKLRAFGKAPPTRHLRNDVSRQLREQHEPGSCFFLDLGPVHPIDFQGHRFSRLGVDWASGFVHVTFAETAGSSSLCSQLDELTSLARQRAGRAPCMFRMDFGSEAAVQGRGDDCITEGLSAYMDAHPGVRIVPNGPGASGWNMAENAWQRVHGMSYLNHLRAHIGPMGWSLMERGAAWQYNRHAAVDPPGAAGPPTRTRLEAFTGLTWDVSTAAGYVGQGGWVHRPDGTASALRPLVEPCLYLHPSENAVGHVVFLLRTMRMHIVRGVTLIEGPGNVLAELARSALHQAGGLLTDPLPDEHAARLAALFASADLVGDGAVVEYNEATGMPMRIIALVPRCAARAGYPAARDGRSPPCSHGGCGCSAWRGPSAQRRGGGGYAGERGRHRGVR